MKQPIYGPSEGRLQRAQRRVRMVMREVEVWLRAQSDTIPASRMVELEALRALVDGAEDEVTFFSELHFFVERLHGSQPRLFWWPWARRSHPLVKHLRVLMRNMDLKAEIESLEAQLAERDRSHEDAIRSMQAQMRRQQEVFTEKVLSLEGQLMTLRKEVVALRLEAAGIQLPPAMAPQWRVPPRPEGDEGAPGGPKL